MSYMEFVQLQINYADWENPAIKLRRSNYSIIWNEQY